MAKSSENLLGFQLPFGRVIAKGPYNERGMYHTWMVQCSMCGYVRSLSGSNVKRTTGLCPSCAQKGDAPTIIGGKRRTEYLAWCGMMDRCGIWSGRNSYVEQGITVCQDWQGKNGFAKFLDHIGPKPRPDLVLDRIDNQGNYEPGNVRWATRSQSNENKSNAHIVEIDGIKKSVSTWCAEYGIYPEAAYSRVKSGWTWEQAIKIPFRPTRVDIDRYYLAIAEDVSVRSTCVRRSVGCVIVDSHGYAISTGYNSVPSELPHCTDKPCPGALAKSGTELHACIALHAEDVAIMKCKDKSEIATLYVTCSPCIFCTRRLLNTSCKRIVFSEKYAHDDECRKLWESVGRTWVHIPL